MTANHSPDVIEKQLERILASPDFDATDRLKDFLRFVVRKKIDGLSHEIKGYTVATSVFGRQANFDPKLDPIVSIEANRLRRALERYYLLAGRNDPVRIDIPKGSYVPTFTDQTVDVSDTVVRDREPGANVEERWPSVLILPFTNLTGDPEKNFLGTGFASELSVELARFQEVRVIFPFEGRTEAPSGSRARFVLNGSIYQDQTDMKITAHLTDTKTGEQIWGETQRSSIDIAKFVDFQEQAVQVIATKTTGEVGIIPKIMAPESKYKRPSELSTYEAILRYYEYEQSLSPKNLLTALAALKHAAFREPECGKVWSMLAGIYVNLYMLDIELADSGDPLENAIEYAEKGAHMNPNNQRAVGHLAYTRFCCNDLTAAREEVHRAYELNPNSLMSLDLLAYLMTLAGDWEQGTALIRKSIHLNPYYRRLVHYALWVDCLRREQYDRAHMETMGLNRHDLFWYPLAKAASLGLLKRKEEGEKFVSRLLELRPDFPKKGRELISRYIKFEEISERVAEGLHYLGLKI